MAGFGPGYVLSRVSNKVFKDLYDYLGITHHIVVPVAQIPKELVKMVLDIYAEHTPIITAVFLLIKFNDSENENYEFCVLDLGDGQLEDISSLLMDYSYKLTYEGLNYLKDFKPFILNVDGLDFVVDAILDNQITKRPRLVVGIL